MKKITAILTTLALAGIFTANAADTKDKQRAAERSENRRTVADIDKRIATLNKLDNNPSAFQAGLAAVSKETAVPLPTIEAEHKQHAKVGLAGLFMAYELSVKTHKPADTFLKQHAAGRTWTELVRANSQSLTEVDEKLTRIEAAMQNPTPASNAAIHNDRTAVREKDSPKSELDTRIGTLNTLDDQPTAMRAGLTAVSKETAVPLTQVEDLHKQQTSAGLGDLFVAQELATHTQKPASDFLKQHSGGKSWTQIVSDNNQNRSEIEQKLSRIEQAMRDAK